MSYLLFRWFKNERIPVIATRVNDFRSSFLGWAKQNNPSTYDHIYILDLDTSQDSMDVVDLPNVVIIDHHDTHAANKHKYKKAKTFIRRTPSCAKLIYDLLNKKSEVTLTDQQKHLMLLVDDYDSYELQLKGSHELNLLFWNYQGNKVTKFVSDFYDGFNGFTPQEDKIINFYKKKISQTINSLDMFEALITISKKERKIVSAFATTCINDVAEYIIKTNKAEIGIVVNLQSKKVSFRKDKASDVDLSKIAKKLTDGGGHTFASGGMVTNKFLAFTRLFRPIPK
jgi:nanoRNase/pAp phosphatase (c-di-AMP/oligoRNAs hydrolase)